MLLPCRNVAAAAGSLMVLSLKTNHHRVPGVACNESGDDDAHSSRRSATSLPDHEHGRVGTAVFWTLLHCGRGTVALRNSIRQCCDDGRLMYDNLATEFAALSKETASQAVNSSGELESQADSMSIQERCDQLWLQCQWWLHAQRYKLSLLARPAHQVSQFCSSSAACDVGDDSSAPPSKVAAPVLDSSVPFVHDLVAVQPGDAFGQLCRLTPAAEKHILDCYKSHAGVRGQSNLKGINLADFIDTEGVLGNGAQPILSEDDIVGFEEMKNYHLPRGLEDKFQIHVFPLSAQEGPDQRNVVLKEGLSLGEPHPYDVFQNAPFTGSFHGLGIVPAIYNNQFLCGSGMNSCWVRFDKKDLQTYDHDLEGVPILEDETGIFFEVTHLWVDFSIPNAASFAMEWFCGARCLARKESSVWPLPNLVFQSLVGIGFKSVMSGLPVFRLDQ